MFQRDMTLQRAWTLKEVWNFAVVVENVVLDLNGPIRQFLDSAIRRIENRKIAESAF